MSSKGVGGTRGGGGGDTFADTLCSGDILQNVETGCRINGQEVAREKEVTIPEDPCLKCHCENGLMTCTKEACPVLHCPKERIVSVLGECCQQCNGSRRLIEPPKGSCMLGSAIHLAGKSYHLDRCTHCICQNGTSVCRRTACPVLECPPEKQLSTPGHCCPHCPLRWEKEFKTTCTVGGHTYEASTKFTHMDFYY
uniref:VWFC domain-containing protein n=1 Tax=Timema cristinae TaxID=61476 RepID=A0A7R9H3N1_TIMCR|nr:unnamed protein product [Timema cristinae]